MNAGHKKNYIPVYPNNISVECFNLKHQCCGEVPSPFPLMFFIIFLVTGFFQASARMPPRGIYSDVTLLSLLKPF
jgi:hypothetical protein